MTRINANIPRKGRNHKLAGRYARGPDLHKRFLGSVATNQTTADVKERNHSMTNTLNWRDKDVIVSKFNSLFCRWSGGVHLSLLFVFGDKRKLFKHTSCEQIQ